MADRMRVHVHVAEEWYELAMRRDIANFLFDNLAQLHAYDTVKVYYDNGQHTIAKSLHRAIEYATIQPPPRTRSSSASGPISRRTY